MAMTEFRTAKGILEEEKAKLFGEGVVADDIQVGIMIEIQLLRCLRDHGKEADFLIGTTTWSNTQWLLTVWPNVYSFTPYNPSISIDQQWSKRLTKAMGWYVGEMARPNCWPVLHARADESSGLKETVFVHVW